MDGPGGLVDLFLARGELPVGREGGRDVDVVIIQVRPGVDDEEVAVLEAAVVLGVVDEAVVRARGDDDAVGALLGAFLLADVVEDGRQLVLHHARAGRPA